MNTKRENGPQGSAAGAETDVQGPAVWSRVCARLGAEIAATEYDQWIKPLRFIAEVDGSVLIVAKTQFAFDRVHSAYKRDIQRAWKALDPKARSIRLECWGSSSSDIRNFFDNPWAVEAQPAVISKASALPPADLARNLMGPLVMRFDTLVTGASNAVAAKVARGIAAGANQVPASVIVINGLQGVGKTHLMKSLEAALETNEDQSVAYISAEEFYVAYVEGATTGDTRALKARVRQADVVLFDDLQVIAGKKGTNTELAGTIRTVSERGGIVVLTADRAPCDMQGLSDGVMTVLKGAACVEIAMPDDAMRAQIVRERAGMLAEASPNFVIDEDMCAQIVSRVHGPGRDLCGAVISLYTETELGEVAPTMDMLERVLSRQHKPKPVTLDMIKRAVCKAFDMNRTDLEGERKFQRFVRARQIGMYLARETTEKSFPQIGISFGKRHHTTALYAWRKINKAVGKDADLSAEVTRVKQIVTQMRAGTNS